MKYQDQFWKLDETGKYVKTPFSKRTGAAPWTYVVNLVSHMLWGHFPKPVKTFPWNGKVSCLITAYRKSSVLHKALRSVVDQTLPFDEVLVLTMTDEDTAVAKIFEGKGVRVIPHERLDIIESRNFLTKEARNDWVFHLDGDDYIDIDYLAFIDARARKEPAAIYFSLRVWQQYYGSTTMRFRRDTKSRANLLNWNFAAVVHKKVFEDFPIDSRFKALNEDLDFWYRVYKSEYKAVAEDRVPVYYVQSRTYNEYLWQNPVTHCYEESSWQTGSPLLMKVYNENPDAFSYKVRDTEDWPKMLDDVTCWRVMAALEDSHRQALQESCNRKTENIFDIKTYKHIGMADTSSYFLEKYIGCELDVLVLVYPDLRVDPLNQPYGFYVHPSLEATLQEVSAEYGFAYTYFLVIKNYACAFLSETNCRTVTSKAHVELSLIAGIVPWMSTYRDLFIANSKFHNNYYLEDFNSCRYYYRRNSRAIFRFKTDSWTEEKISFIGNLVGDKVVYLWVDKDFFVKFGEYAKEHLYNPRYVVPVSYEDSIGDLVDLKVPATTYLVYTMEVEALFNGKMRNLVETHTESPFRYLFVRSSETDHLCASLYGESLRDYLLTAGISSRTGCFYYETKGMGESVCSLTGNPCPFMTGQASRSEYCGMSKFPEGYITRYQGAS